MFTALKQFFISIKYQFFRFFVSLTFIIILYLSSTKNYWKGALTKSFKVELQDVSRSENVLFRYQVFRTTYSHPTVNRKCEHVFLWTGATLWHELSNKRPREHHRQRWRGYSGQVLLTESSAHLTSWTFQLDRGQVKLAIALMFGHSRFRKHLHTPGIIYDSQECRLCNQSRRNAKYVILDCERLWGWRKALIGYQQPREEMDAIVGRKSRINDITLFFTN